MRLLLHFFRKTALEALKQLSEFISEDEYSTHINGEI